MLNKRENSVLVRIESVERAAKLARQFFDLGHTSLKSLMVVTRLTYPEMKLNDIQQFWQFRNMNAKLLDDMETVLNKLKADR